MIYYNQSPPWGQFNRFINDRCLEEIAEYIQRAIPEHIRSWGIKAITEEAAAADVKLGAIRLDHTRTLSVSGDTLYFCSNFDCWFPVGEEDIEDADGASLDVAGKILFFPPGTKKYEFALTGVYRHYQYSEEGQNHTLHFPGVSVNQGSISLWKWWCAARFFAFMDCDNLEHPLEKAKKPCRMKTHQSPRYGHKSALALIPHL